MELLYLLQYDQDYMEYMDYYEYLSEGGGDIKKVAIEDILVDKDNMEVAVDSLRKGMYSDSDAPLEVYKDEGSDKYILGDGHHRLLKAIIDGEGYVMVRVKEGEVGKGGTIGLDLYDGDYYGLDSGLENGWLIRRI